MCAEEPLFSLTPVCHFLSLHPSSPQSTASCPSLLASDVPPAPSGTAQDFTLSLRNVQEVRQTTSKRVAALGLGPTHTCCENDWNQAETYGVFASSWVRHRWIYEWCNLGQWMCKTGVYESSKLYEIDWKTKQAFVSRRSASRASCVRCFSTMSWVVSSSAHCYKTQHAQQEL